MNNKKRFYLIFSLIVAITLCLTGCKPTEQGTMATEIKVWNWGGACGDEWLKEAANRFSELQKEHSYEEGKKGVKFSYGGSTNPGEFDTMDTSTYSIYFTECGSSPYQLAQKGSLYCVDELLNTVIPGEQVTIKSKINDSVVEESLKGRDGHYYALPHFEWYPGLVYDIDTFENKGFYIADSGEEEHVEDYESDFGTVKFINKGYADTVKKSCGNDGEFGTADDGLPTSLVELLVLCDYMSQNGVTPFIVAGNHTDYTTYITTAILSALLGEKINGLYSYSGTFDIVTGFTEENLFDGIDYIKKPITEQVTITEATGYLTRQVVERYYATAIIEIAEKEGWFASDSYQAQFTNLDSQYKFIMGPRNTQGYKPVGFLADGSYWYAESVRNEYFEDYTTYTQKNRRIGFMCAPSSLYTPVTEGNGKVTSLLNLANSYCLINKRVVEANPGVLDAVKDFILFLYSEDELQRFTATTGEAKAGINYNYRSEFVYSKLSEYQKSVLELKNINGVTTEYSSSSYFLNNQVTLRYGVNSPVNMPIINYITYGCDLLAIRKGHTAAQCFEATEITPDKWASLTH